MSGWKHTYSALPILKSGLILAACVLGAQTGRAQDVKLRVEFTGLDRALRSNVEAVTAVARTKKAQPAEIERLLRQAPAEIETALQPFGYYRPRIQAELSRGDQTWTAHYAIDPGPALLLGQVDVRVLGDGSRDSTLLELVEGFPLAVGDTLDHAAYDLGKEALASRVAERGYLDAVFDTSEIRVDTAAYTSEIVLHLSTGPRFLFGPVTVHQTTVDSIMIVGHIPFRQGDSLDLKLVQQMKSQLTQAPYFGRAEVELRREAANGLEVPVDVTLTARKRQRFEVGLGYGTDTGIRGRLEARFRRLNRKGHNATIRLDASQIERTLTIKYQIPPPYPRTATWAATIGAGDFSPVWSQSKRLTFGVNRSQAVLTGRGLLSLSIEGDDFEIADTRDSSLLLILGTDWLRLRTDNLMFPSRGLSTRIYGRGSHEAVVSTVSFIQVGVEAKLTYGFFPAARMLARGQIAHTWTGNFDGLPPEIRFVTGGAQTVRGYDYQTLGPRNDQGQILGGPALITASIEMDYLPIKKAGQWGLAVFIDTGNALENFRHAELAVGSGIGLRWVSPVGMLRLDLAWAMSREGRPTIVHFNMGPYL